jgi:hypothetical protein
VISELLDTGQAGSGQRSARQNGEPDIDLVEPGAVGRREVEADIVVAGQPTITLGLVRRQIVEDDVDFLARMVGDDAVHEVDEFHAPAPLVVAGRQSGEFARSLAQAAQRSWPVSRTRPMGLHCRRSAISCRLHLR